MNILHEFFNHRSDASNLEASEQEKLEKDFAKWYDKQSENFEFVVKPVIKYLAENHSPHTKAIVESDKAEVVEGIVSTATDEFIVD